MKKKDHKQCKHCAKCTCKPDLNVKPPKFQYSTEGFAYFPKELKNK